MNGEFAILHENIKKLIVDLEAYNNLLKTESIEELINTMGDMEYSLKDIAYDIGDKTHMIENFKEYKEIERYCKENLRVVNEEAFKKIKGIATGISISDVAYGALCFNYGLEWLEENTTVIKHPTKNKYKIVEEGK